MSTFLMYYLFISFGFMVYIIHCDMEDDGAIGDPEEPSLLIYLLALVMVSVAWPFVLWMLITGNFPDDE